MTSVRAILESKGTTVFTTAPGASVLEALQLMGKHNVGVLLVVRGQELQGIFSERDYARKVVLRGRTAELTPVADVMTPRIVSVSPDTSIDDCMNLMTTGRFRHLPVIDQGRLVGVVSIGDIVKMVIAEREQTIQQLTNYITGTRT